MARNVALTGREDIIVAPATAPGAAAIAIVRLSGAGSVALADGIFSRRLSDASHGQLVLGSIREYASGAEIDRCLAAWWKAPRSYTGEEMVEWHLHGSPATADAAMRSCIAAGARPAEPGEFTRRAFLNGKLDLSQAEGVLDLTSSQTEDARRAALQQLHGGLSKFLAEIRTDLIDVVARMEAAIDYPDEDIPAPAALYMTQALSSARGRLQQLVESYGRGRRLREGARVVFAGAPNAGKSSLFNAILGRERAIVTPHPGTTRDTLEATVDIGGIPVTLVDTAGLRDTTEEIEAAGIERTREQLASADLVVFVVDSSAPDAGAPPDYETVRESPHIVALNKCDQRKDAPAIGGFASSVINVSARTRQGIGELEAALVSRLTGKTGEGGSAVTITSLRHAEALRLAIESLDAAFAALSAKGEPDLAVIDLQSALSHLDTITGAAGLDEAILDVIFSQFCLGK
ncbi:tRNA uridine-5-carboxymethylaminomethyl(34) synthesis GTPase MnmE [soil metagenome]